MQQLKNAGGMRLIKSNNSIDEIIRYDTKLKKLANQQLYYENYQNKTIETGTEIFNIYSLLNTMQNPDLKLGVESFMLLNDDKSKLKVFGNDVTMYKGIIEYYLDLLEELKQQGDKLNNTLNREYNL